MLRAIIACLFVLGAVSPSLATSGPGCLVVVNVASDDALNLRARASAFSAIVDRPLPAQHGIIHLDGKCVPLSRPWGSRWCPVTHYNGDQVTKGWVKARFVRDSDWPLTIQASPGDDGILTLTMPAVLSQSGHARPTVSMPAEDS